MNNFNFKLESHGPGEREELVTNIRWELIIRCARMMENRSFRVKYPICAGSRTNQKPYTGQIAEIAPYVRTYL